MRKFDPSARHAAFEEACATAQACDHPRCPEPGLYRAPKARQRLTEYYWFCLDHVRDYNRMWNYYEGMAPAEIEAHIRQDTVWQRPSWPLGGWFAQGRHDAADGIHDGFGSFGERARRSRRDAPAGEAQPRTAEERALAALDLVPPVTLEEVKLRYKELVKRLHPDANGGDKAAEERLKVINQAYGRLKNSTTLKGGAYA